MPPRSPEHLSTPHGACVVIELEPDDLEAQHAALAALPAEEQAHARTLGAARRRDFVTGRRALHEALGDHRTPILTDDRGAPILPAGWVGSVSHKGPFAAALVAPHGNGSIGIDLERAAPPRQDIARRILTPRELAALPETDRGRHVTLRFSIKEAIYKAVDPFVRRYVGFTEVELELAGPRCIVTSALPLTIDACWREHAGHWLTTARARAPTS
jgi:enterobactin synthetase component D